MCTPMLIAALFTIARTWKKPRCPLADEWIRKLWYIYTMEYYSAIKKSTNNKCWRRCGEKETILHCWQECEHSSTMQTFSTMENSVKIPSKPGNRTAIPPRNPTAGHTCQGNQNLKEIRVPHCSLQHCLQQLGHGSNLDVHWQMNG